MVTRSVKRWRGLRSALGRRRVRPLSDGAACALVSASGGSILAERVLDRNLSVPEREQIAAGNLDSLAVLERAGEGPFRHASIARHEVSSIAPVRIRILLEHCGVRSLHGTLPLVSLAVHGVA